MLYIIIIAAVNVAVTLVNWIFASHCGLSALPVWLLLSVYATAAVIAYDGLTAFLIRRLPERWFAPASPAFDVSRAEKKIYRKFNVRALASRVPELGGFTGFHKDKLRSSSDAGYLARFLLESNYGVVIHVVNALGGFVIIWLPFMRLSVSLPVFITNLILSMLPALVLRANTPGLRALYLRSVAGKKAEK